MNRRSAGFIVDGASGPRGAARVRQERDARPVAKPDPEPLDPEFVERIRESLADPRPNIAAAEVRAELKALHEARLKRGA